jgi:hypothetical protein
MKNHSSFVLRPSSFPSRLLLWIDAVGGYLVCLGDEISLGPPGAGADVPILGDLSRRHATIRRDGEGYLVEPSRPVKLDGQPLARPATLADGSVLALGESVQVRFRRPHPLSGSARLEIVSRHKTVPSVDAVLLMADSLILGPGNQCHVPCRDWRREMVLFRRGEKLFCRSDAPYEIDGQQRRGKAEIRYNSCVSGEEFSLSLERLGESC